MPLTQIKENLEKAGFTVDVKSSALVLTFKGDERTVDIPPEWMREIKISGVR